MLLCTVVKLEAVNLMLLGTKTACCTCRSGFFGLRWNCSIQRDRDDSTWRAFSQWDEHCELWDLSSNKHLRNWVGTSWLPVRGFFESLLSWIFFVLLKMIVFLFEQLNRFQWLYGLLESLNWIFESNLSDWLFELNPLNWSFQRIYWLIHWTFYFLVNHYCFPCV